MSEHDTQAAFFEWVRYMANRDSRYRLIWAIPNAAKRSWWLGKRMRAEGLTKGAPDVIVAVPCGGYHGMFIEFKYGKNTTTPEQKEMLGLLQGQNYLAVVVFEVDHAVEVVSRYFAMGSSNGDFNRATSPRENNPDSQGERVDSPNVIYLKSKNRRNTKRQRD